MIAGEPGTGREAVARAIHAASSNAGRPFVAIDCDADPDRKLSLFLNGAERVGEPGRSRGGGTRQHAGGDGWHDAQGGTLFLRNPFDLPVEMQGRLARLLRDGAVGQRRQKGPVQWHVRPMAAVDCEFRARAGDGAVRPELYRRFAGIRIDLPPLRALANEIPGFAQALVAHFCDERQVATKRLTPPAAALLSAFPWWGNVFELRELVDALVRQTPDDEIDLQSVLRHVHLDGARAVPVAVGTLREARGRFEREYIAAALARHRGRIGVTAHELGLERANLYCKMRQLGIRRQSA